MIQCVAVSVCRCVHDDQIDSNAQGCVLPAPDMCAVLVAGAASNTLV
jgi:hypothetical protein